jgi:hypothetical protein
VAPSGAIYLVGSMEGSVDFGDGKIETSAGMDDAFVARFEPNGSIVWSKLFGDAQGAQYAKHVAVDETEQVFVAGTFMSTLSFGGATLTADGIYDVFVAKLDSSGFPLGARRFGGGGVEDIGGLAVDGAGSVLIDGTYEGAIDFFGQTLPGEGVHDVYVAKLSGTLERAWVKHWGSSDYQEADDIAVDTTNGDAVVVGSFWGAFDVEGAVLKAAGPYATNLYAVRLSTNGDLVWAHAYGDATSNVFFPSVDLVPGGVMMVGGYFSGALNFDGKPVPMQGGIDAFLAKLDPGGAVAGVAILPGDDMQAITALKLGPMGEPYIGAAFISFIDLGGTVVTSSDPTWGDAVLARLQF